MRTDRGFEHSGGRGLDRNRRKRNKFIRRAEVEDSDCEGFV
jgi:hypothetical protein